MIFKQLFDQKTGTNSYLLSNPGTSRVSTSETPTTVTWPVRETPVPGGPEADTMSATKLVKEALPDEIEDLRGFRIIDVRQPEEFDGELSHIEGAELVPLATLPAQAANWPPDDKLLIVCRSGGRASQACEYLVTNGFNDVTNLMD